MRVAVSVHGRFHGFDLARELHRRGHLAGLLTTYPRFAVRRHAGDIGNVATAPALELRRRLCQRLSGLCRGADEKVARGFGAFAARRLPSCDLLVGWSSATLEAIPVARERGARVVIERGSTHIEHQTDVMTEVFRRAGMQFSGTSAEIIGRELAEYDLADAITVPSAYAARTFIERGVAREKILINPYGVDLDRFSPPPERDHPRPRVLFVGQVGYRKGAPELLDAFAPLAGRAELRLVGPVEPRMSIPGAGHILTTGALPMAALPAEYQAADIFCLPSWEEGFPLVILQAMACGLPVVATEAAGAGNIITSGVEGRIIGAGDTAALTEALAGLVDDAERREEMGRAARARVQKGFAWEDYGRRAVDLYARLIAAGG